VILGLIDDLGWTDLGCYGSDYYRTPNIDRFATNFGIRKIARSQSSECHLLEHRQRDR
jgi:hypothetical protein